MAPWSMGGVAIVTPDTTPIGGAVVLLNCLQLLAILNPWRERGTEFSLTFSPQMGAAEVHMLKAQFELSKRITLPECSLWPRG